MSTGRPSTSAVAGRSGYVKLRYCRVLLGDLDPRRPPAAAKSSEFQWQYRALNERVQVYSKCLAKADEPESPDPALERAETAIDLSIEYFQTVLSLNAGTES